MVALQIDSTEHIAIFELLDVIQHRRNIFASPLILTSRFSVSGSSASRATSLPPADSTVWNSRPMAN